MMIQNLLIGITFHFIRERIEFLQKMGAHFSQLSNNTKVFVVTNTESSKEHAEIQGAIGCDVKIHVPKLIGHPYLLTWAHLDIFRKFYDTELGISHFMYLEDDILIRPNNITYWLNGRENLRKVGLIPSFLRYELKNYESEMYSTDVTSSLELRKLPKVVMRDRSYCYINFPQPYQGMYLLDRELAKEHLFGPSSSPDFGVWGIREKAAQGLTFANVPAGCISRNFVGFSLEKNQIDPNALIHHMPNNYANNPQSKFGKLAIRNLVV